MNKKYYKTAILATPLLPLMYFQAKKVMASFPKLPEAQQPEGKVLGQSAKTMRVLCLGESTIAGVGVATHKEGFAGHFAKALSAKTGANIDWQVYARSGFTAQKVADKLVPTIKEKSVDLIVIGLGANNAFALHSPRRFLREMQFLIDVLHKKYPETPLAFANMPPIRDFPAITPLIQWTVGNLIESFGEAFATHIKGQQKVFYNAEILSVDKWISHKTEAKTAADFFSDGVHPSKLTYQLWAEDFADFVWREVFV